MNNDPDHSGIPTQAIHEAYLDMQRSLKAYRQAKDRGSTHEVQQAHGEVQEGVLTFYELLRPHLRHEQGVTGYWQGELPAYPGDGQPPDPDEGAGVLQVQERREVHDLPEGYDTLDGLRDWHEALGLNGNTRLVGISGQGDCVLTIEHRYQLGLRQLDEWETTYTTTSESVGGFYATKRTEQTERQRIPIDRLKRAARELSEVADELGLLTPIEAGELTKDKL
jgi:hypothetical protein